MIKPILAALSAMLLISACGKRGELYTPPVFPVEETMTYELVHDDLLTPPLINFMDVYKDYLVMVYIDFLDKTWVHVHDKHTGERLVTALNMGRGPLEIGEPTATSFDHETGELIVLGYESQNLMVIQVDSLVETGVFAPKILDDEIFSQPNVKNVTSLGGGKYLLRMRPFPNYATYRRFVIYKDGEVLDYYDAYPMKDLWLMEMSYSYTSLPLSPDKTKFAYGTFRGGIVEYFDISADSIKRTRIDHYYEPMWNDDRNSTDDELSGYGFADMAADDKYVYASCGEPGEDLKINKIAVYDWDGTPVKILRSDEYREFYPIAVDRANGDLYSYVENPTGEQHIIRIKPDLE